MIGYVELGEISIMTDVWRGSKWILNFQLNWKLKQNTLMVFVQNMWGLKMKLETLEKLLKGRSQRKICAICGKGFLFKGWIGCDSYYFHKDCLIEDMIHRYLFEGKYSVMVGAKQYTDFPKRWVASNDWRFSRDNVLEIDCVISACEKKINGESLGELVVNSVIHLKRRHPTFYLNPEWNSKH